MGDAPVTGLPRWPLDDAEARLLESASAVADSLEQGLAAPLPDRGRSGTDEAGLIGAFHAVRALRCLRTVVVTCRSGYAVESAPLVRSMLEDSVSLRYLSLRPHSRVRAWLHFDEQRSLEYWKLSERLGLGLQKSDHIRRIEDGRNPSGSPVWWSNKTPSAMARELKGADPDLSQTFKALYPWLSDVAHANIKTTSSYYFADGDEEPALRVGPSNHLMQLMVSLSVALSVRICVTAHDLGAEIEIAPILAAKGAFDQIDAAL
ncbi:MAG: DUF5677 domain-containing protein [Anaerosomatales bacterium]|nr:DUF5677 domain-containing protein [Anaerosomatales bacterium]MDT8433937.1 DUF5677 domain-containing protein [Anaerosomatales bacterium]